MEAVDTYTSHPRIGDDYSPFWRINVFTGAEYEHREELVSVPNIAETLQTGRRFHVDSKLVETTPANVTVPVWNGMVKSIRVKLTKDSVKVSEATIVLRSGDGGILLDPTIQRGRFVRIDMGYMKTPAGPDFGPVFFGRIGKVESSFAESSVDITVTCNSMTWELLWTPVSQIMPPGSSVGAIAQMLATAAGLALDIGENPPPAPRGSELIFGNWMACVVKLAESIGWHAWVDHFVLHIRPEPVKESAIALFEWRSGLCNIYSAKFSVDPLLQAANVSANLDDQNATPIISVAGSIGQAVTLPGSSAAQIQQQQGGGVAGSSMKLDTHDLDPQTVAAIGANYRKFVNPWPVNADLQGLLDLAVQYPAKNQIIGGEIPSGVRLDDPRSWYASEQRQFLADRGVWPFSDPGDFRSVYEGRYGELHYDREGRPAATRLFDLELSPDLQPTIFEHENLPTSVTEVGTAAGNVNALRAIPYTLEITGVGNWLLRPMDKFLARGLSDLYDGEWLTEEIDHDMDDRGKYVVTVRGQRRLNGDPVNAPITDETWRALMARYEAQEQLAKNVRRREEVLSLLNGRIDALRGVLKMGYALTFDGTATPLNPGGSPSPVPNFPNDPFVSASLISQRIESYGLIPERDLELGINVYRFKETRTVLSFPFNAFFGTDQTLQGDELLQGPLEGSERSLDSIRQVVPHTAAVLRLSQTELQEPYLIVGFNDPSKDFISGVAELAAGTNFWVIPERSLSRFREILSSMRRFTEEKVKLDEYIESQQ